MTSVIVGVVKILLFALTHPNNQGHTMRHEKEPDTTKDVFIDGNHIKGGNWTVCMDATPETSAVYYFKDGYTYCSFLSNVCFSTRK